MFIKSSSKAYKRGSRASNVTIFFIVFKYSLTKSKIMVGKIPNRVKPEERLIKKLNTTVPTC